MKDLGQLFMFGIEGAKVTPEVRSFIKDTNCGGIILFKRNVVDVNQLKTFIDDLQNASDTPLIIGVDQEGGRVMRLSQPFTQLPPMEIVGKASARNPHIAFKVGELLGRELSAIGFNLDFAPVLDVATNKSNPIIGDRAFSSKPDLVAMLGVDFILGLQGEGVAACGKHFPGHGDTSVDSHLDLPVLKHNRERFDECEFLPFRAAIEKNVASIMTSHLFVPNLDPDAIATVSKKITTDILRKDLGFDGLVFTDDLIMKGIANKYSPGDSAWRAINAGADIAIICHDANKERVAIDNLKRAIDDGSISENQVKKSLKRVADFKAKFCNPNSKRPSMEVIGSAAHQDILRLLSC